MVAAIVNEVRAADSCVVSFLVSVYVGAREAAALTHCACLRSARFSEARAAAGLVHRPGY